MLREKKDNSSNLYISIHYFRRDKSNNNLFSIPTFSVWVMDNYNFIKSKLKGINIPEDTYNRIGVHVDDLQLEKRELFISILKNEFLSN